MLASQDGQAVSISNGILVEDFLDQVLSRLVSQRPPAKRVAWISGHRPEKQKHAVLRSLQL